MSSNWKNLKRKLSTESSGSSTSTIGMASAGLKKKRTDISDAVEKSQQKPVVEAAVKKIRPKLSYVGLDCEMVGIGLSGKHSALARCSMVRNLSCNALYDLILIFVII